jgi:hypothetical protein
MRLHAYAGHQLLFIIAAHWQNNSLCVAKFVLHNQ